MEITTKRSFFFFSSFFLHTWLYLLMTPALILLVIPRLQSYNGVEVYYLKGVIGLPIVISFRDRWYYIFCFGNGLIDDVIVIGWTDSDFRISRALTHNICFRREIRKILCGYPLICSYALISAKNIRILYIESTKTIKEMTLNELVKLTMLWTTRPWSSFPYYMVKMLLFT